MIFKRPYAFFIKYFRLINLILSGLVLTFIIKLYNIHNILNKIYLLEVNNYNFLNEDYIGFFMFFLILVICSILLLIIILFKRKKKPFKDYLFLLFYNVVIVIYLIIVSNLFFELSDKIVEQTNLKNYSDISLIIVLPLIYFFIKYFLTAIGFNLNKFDFNKDIDELRTEDSDDEEFELVFNKNSYKYKRGFRKKLREFKYYFLENKLFVIIFLSIFILICGFGFFKMFKSEDRVVKLNESFVINSISFKINRVYETKYDLNSKIINNDYKYVIVDANVKNLSDKVLTINFEHMRVFFENSFSYASNYFNKNFIDLGNGYDKENLITGEDYNYLFVFQVPNSYKSNKYKIKFYGGMVRDDKNELQGIYNVLNVNAINLDKNIKKNHYKIGEKVFLDKKQYGESSLTINSYAIKNSFTIEKEGKYKVIRPNSINDVVLGMDIDFVLDENSILFDVNNSIYDFFNKHLRIEYTYNGSKYNINSVKLIKSDFDNKIFVSIPSEIKDAEDIKFKIYFRNLEIIFESK